MKIANKKGFKELHIQTISLKKEAKVKSAQ